MKLALVGSRTGYVHRGFESFTRNLFETVRNDIDVTLFKGAGPRRPREIPITSFRYEGGILSKFDLSWQRRMIFQERTFALALAPFLLRGKYDIVHFSEVVLGRMLLRLRRMTGLRFKLLFSNGAPAPPQFYECFDAIQQVNAVRLDDALQYGIPQERLYLIPYGVDCARFRRCDPLMRRSLRRKLGVPENDLVVLCVAALKSHHKRIDYLIREFACMGNANAFLLLVGERTEETGALEIQAETMLGGRYKTVTATHEEIHEFYQLADLFVLPSIREGLPISVLEAMSSALPVVLHEDPLFEWAVEDPRCLIDMESAGALASKMENLANDEAERQDLASCLSRRARDRFDWRSLRPRYLDMYDQVARSQLGGG